MVLKWFSTTTKRKQKVSLTDFTLRPTESCLTTTDVELRVIPRETSATILTRSVVAWVENCMMKDKYHTETERWHILRLLLKGIL